MKLKFNLLAGAVLALGVSLSAWAQPEPAVGADKPLNAFNNIEVKNLQDESLGRIMDLGLDLVNGRIVEVLVKSDSSLNVDNKIVAVPPHALIRDQLNEVYRLNVSTDMFKTAEAIDLSKWLDAGRSERVAAAYHLFGQVPFFLEEGQTASKTDRRPRVPLGYVERSFKILDMPVENLQGVKFGKVWSMSMDVPRGRILNVVIIAPGQLRTRSIVPAMALSFNATRDTLLLDDSKVEYADEPRFVYTEEAFGNKEYSNEESYTGPHTSVALEQGRSYRDVDRTVRINKDIRAAKINARNVQVGTINGRVTLRGWVHTNEDKRRIGEIAIADARQLELVDNQIVVGKPAN